MNKITVSLLIFVTMVFCFCRCAQSLNEKNPDASNALQKVCGVQYEPKKDSENTTNGKTSEEYDTPTDSSSELSVGTLFSMCIYDFTILFPSSEEETYTFPVESGWYYYMDFEDVESTWFSWEDYTPMDALFTVYDANGAYYGDGDSAGIYGFEPTLSGTYSITVAPYTSGTSGCCAVRLYRRSKSLPYQSVSVYSSYDSSSGYKKVSVGSGSGYSYYFWVTSGTTYRVTLVGKGNSIAETVLGSATTTYATYAIYTEEGDFVAASDNSNIDFSFKADSSGRYIITVQTWGQKAKNADNKIVSYASGTVAFRIYKDE